MSKMIRAALVAALVGLVSTQVHAQSNLPPPAPPGTGSTLIDLNGTPATIASYNDDGTCANCLSSITTYSDTFTAGGPLATLTFAFRNDPGFFGFTDVQLVAGTTAETGTNLITDPNFQAAYASSSVGGGYNGDGITFASDPSCSTAGVWCTYNQSVQGLGFPVASPASPETSGSGITFGPGTYFWQDGATQGYEGLFQNVNVLGGQQYTVSFQLIDMNPNAPGTEFNGTPNSQCPGGVTYVGASDDPPSNGDYSSTSQNGDSTDVCGNGADVVVYAGFPGTPNNPDNPPAPPAPEPASLVLLGSGVFGLGLLRRFVRRR